MTKPIELGGLNIRKTEHLNTALLAKLAWRMLHEPDTLWVQILRHKYFLNSNPLHVVQSESVSWIWKGICRGLELVRKHCCWEVGDGNSIEIWKDYWLPNRNSSLDASFASSNMKTVNQLIVQDSGKWNVYILNALFDTDTVSGICNIRIPLSGKDTLRWSPTYNGQFSVKSDYKCIVKEIYGGEASNFPWKSLWKLDVPQKIKHFLWKCMNDCVSVRSKLARYVDSISNVCPLCEHEEETINHLFIDCEVTKRLWFSLDANIAGSILNVNPHEWIKSWFQINNGSGKGQEYYIKFVSFAIWHIWKLRCSVVFDNDSNVVALVNKELNDSNVNSMRCMNNNSHPRQNRTLTPWQLPVGDFHKINFDAAFKKNNKQMSIGLMLFSDAGKCWGA